MKKDPVCGMMIDEQSAQAKASHKGQTYYFCSEECKKEFERQPERYTEPATVK